MSAEQNPVDLGTDADGNDVTEQAVSLNLGSGLSHAVKVTPITARKGDELWIAAKVRVKGVRFDYGDPESEDEDEREKCAKVLILKPLAATFVDGVTVRAAVQAQVDAIAEAEALARDGQLALGLDGLDDEIPAPGPRATKDRAQHPDLASQVDAAFDGAASKPAKVTPITKATKAAKKGTRK